MKNLTLTICLTLAVLLGSAGTSWGADYQKGLVAAKSGDFATALREWKPLADWLNQNDYKTPRGKMFHGSHAHSIVKKKKTREVRLTRKYPPKLSNFALRFVDRTLINQ